jgi:N-acyl-L-homoserine lactone synthetase
MFTIKEATFNTESTLELNKLFSLRYKVFHSRLNWGLEVDTVFQQERDQYDVMGTKYLYVLCPQKNIVGCWRIIATTTDYMLKKTFPELLDHEAPPCSENIYELSRFAVDKDVNTSQIKSSQVTKAMFKAIYDYAQNNGITEFVTVTSVGVERIVKRSLIPCTRIGNGAVHLLGYTKSVALRIAVDERFKSAVSDVSEDI